MYRDILTVHIAAGAVALAAMWIPIVARKGGLAHRRAGWIFVGAMTVVSLTALVMSVWLMLFDPRAGRGLRLLFFSVFAANAVSSGVRVLKMKERVTPHWQGWDVGLPALLTLLSVLILWVGVRLHDPQVFGLAPVGLAIGVIDLRYWLRPPTSRMHWWFKHMSGMLGGCIAAWSAFVSNLTHLGIWPGTAVAMSVVSVGFPAMLVWMAYYKRKFSTAATKRTIASAADEAEQERGIRRDELPAWR